MDVVVRILIRSSLAVCLAAAVVTPARAQTRLVEPPPGPDVLTRADFHLGAAMLGSDDERFGWDTHWGGEFDLVDYVKGRFTFLGDYQAVLGDELQPFDPNQGNYTLTLSTSWRVGRSSEASIVFNHVSRHLGDREKTFGIAMNVLGGRWLQEVRIGETTIALGADAGGVIQNAFIDYTWMAGGEVRATRPINRRVDGYVRADGELIGVDPAVAERSDTQRGGTVEGGIRLRGRGGVVELFFGYARVVDADPIDRQTRRWALAGFRLLSR